MKKVIALTLATLLLSGCAFVESVESAPQRIVGSAYRAPITLETLAIGKEESAISGKVVAIGEEAWFAPNDAVTGEPVGAVYYRPVIVQVDQSVGKISGEITLQVLSDIDPAIDISDLLPGDEVVAVLYSPEKRESLLLYGINFLGELDKSLNRVNGLTSGDEQGMRLDQVLAKLGLVI